MTLPFHMRAPNPIQPYRRSTGDQAGMTGPVAGQGYSHCLENAPERYRYFLDDVPDFIRISDRGKQK